MNARLLTVIMPVFNERATLRTAVDRMLKTDLPVSTELVVVDAALRPELVPELWEERLLNDGSRHRIYKRYFAAEQLADEIGGETLMAGGWFVAARASLPDRS